VISPPSRLRQTKEKSNITNASKHSDTESAAAPPSCGPIWLRSCKFSANPIRSSVPNTHAKTKKYKTNRPRLPARPPAPATERTESQERTPPRTKNAVLQNEPNPTIEQSWILRHPASATPQALTLQDNTNNPQSQDFASPPYAARCAVRTHPTTRCRLKRIQPTRPGVENRSKP
jgi:hypothetical protein